GKNFVRLKLQGKYNHVPDPNFDGTADAELLEPIVLTKKELGGIVGVNIHKGAGLKAKITNSDLESLEATNIVIDVDDGTAPFAQVKCTQAKYQKVGEAPKVTVKGDIKITNTKKVFYDGKAGKISYQVLLRDGTGMNIDITENKFNQIGGTVLGLLKVNGKDFLSVDVTGSYSEEKKLDGTAQAKMLANYKIADVAGGKYSIWLVSEGAQQTTMTAQVTNGQLMNIGGMVYAALKTGTTESSPNLVEGNIVGTYDVAGGNGLGGAGTLKVVKSTPIGKPIAGYTIVLSDKSQASVSFAKSELVQFGGAIVLVVQDSQGDLVEVGFDGSFDVKTAELTGKGGIKVLGDRTLFKYKDKFEFKLKSAGSEAKIDIQKNDVKSINGATEFEIHYFGPGVSNPFAKASINGDWQRGSDDKSGGTFTGSAGVTTLSDLELKLLQPKAGETPKSGPKKWIEPWSLVIGSGSWFTLTLKSNNPEQSGASVTLNAKAKHNNEEKVTGQLKGEYLLGDEKGFTGSANLNVTSPIELGSASILGRNFGLSIEPGTGFDAQTEKSSLVSAKGKFSLLIKEDNEKIRVGINGNYEKDTGINVTGKAEVLNDLLITKVGANDSLWLKQKSGGDFKVEGNELKSVGGTILLRYDREGKEFLNGGLNIVIDMTKPSPKATGKGQVNLVDKYVVTKSGIKGYYAVLHSGGVELSLVNSELDYIDGQLKASIDKPLETKVIDIDVKGKYTAGSKPSLDVDGTASVVTTTDVYSTQSGFVVNLMAPSDGVKVKIAQSELQELSAGLNLQLDRPKGKGLVKLGLKGKYI
ncbi:MAG: hypothetical protein KJ698_14055, partial [Actinobacteria bacterium]|nr:hypothetical protein [Actinomycetota bacterium]